MLYRILILVWIGLVIPVLASGQEKVNYPYPIEKIVLSLENKQVAMAYMDIKPQQSNGKTVLLLHGKNFNGYYWKDVIAFLAAEGYRVIVPDQIGWGRSDKPILAYSFHMLAENTLNLLDLLKVDRVSIIAHSMGGMLACRFAMRFPERIEKLIVENPIGLEDYKRFVPYRSIQQLTENESKANYESYKKYQQSYYPQWKPEYEQYVKAQAEVLDDTAFGKVAKVNALTYQMIYEQPVCYEFDRILSPTLLIIGQEDRTVVGKDQLTEEQKKQYGQYPALGEKTAQLIKGSKLISLPGVGHIPHVQDREAFRSAVLGFLK
jgi:pimeloyl-ACP methyl ester carboxylesterase